ncbi:MAG: putative peptidoglycan-binding domain protein [Chitinophagaceae bacterium]|nr:putative peptidoglycan-binding domain protein [Chitinophagaceae bacterium]
MTSYQRGAKGPEVKQIQQKLKDLNLYLGEIDGDFGGGTESGIVRFQRSNGLVADGKVGEATWRALSPEQPAIPVPTVTSKPLLDRCLELTGAFETSLPPPGCYAKVSGDFDGQGISFGALQWNIGQGTLQSLFSKLDQRFSGLVDEVFHVNAAEWHAVMKKPRAEQLAWARSIQTPSNVLFGPWKGLFKAIGQRKECQDVQREYVKDVFDEALQLCKTYKVVTERAVALFLILLLRMAVLAPPLSS